jgi:hypothetical protein
MNHETKLIINYIDNSGYYLEKLAKLRDRFNNIKDFENQFGYVVMEILNEEKKLINISRKNIDLPFLTQVYFGGN